MRNTAPGSKELVINGEPRQSAAETLEQLLEELGLGGSPVVAELNGEIVRQNAFGATALTRGDRVELIRFVGGG